MSQSNAAQLEALMAQANISDVVQLAQQSGVATRQVYRLQKGLIHTLPVEEVVKLAQFFDQSVDEFLALFLPTAIHPIPFTPKIVSQPIIDPAELEALQAEGDRLREQLKADAATHLQTVQRLETQMAEQAQALAELQAQLDAQAKIPTIDPAELAALKTEGDRLRAELKAETEAHSQSVETLEARLAAQAAEHAKTLEALKAEYSRLEAQLSEQGDSTQHQWQQEALDILESWLLQWSAAANAAQNNPNFPAKTLVALAQPFEQLLESWGIIPIGTVGETVKYDPKQHQLVKGGFDVKAGDAVMIQNVGYQQGDRLLHRAKVISQ